VTPYGRSADLRVGDRVVTWEGSAYFPPGLVIGRITSVEQDNFGVSKQGILETNVDFHRLEDVFVIQSLDHVPVTNGAGGD
jgi:rod shape-determining protein MreC